MKEHSLYYDDLIPVEGVKTYQTKRGVELDDFIQEQHLSTYPVIRMDQTHSDHITEITKQDSLSKHTPIIVPDTDAIITTQKNVVLTVKTADCLPLLIYHPNGIIAGIHAGRKSTEQHITQKTLQKLKSMIKKDSGFYIWLGPSISKDCYEIDPVSGDCFDLVQQNMDQIGMECDLNKITLIQSGFCTVKQNDIFYSYRKENTSLRQDSIIALL